MLEIAAQTMTRVLEAAAFIFTDRMGDGDKPALDTWQAEGVSLRFSGKPSGIVHMWVSNGFARCVAANMLGIDQESGAAQEKGLDALKEMLNMIVGNFLTAAFGEALVFELGLPEKTSPAFMEKHYNSKSSLWLQAEGNPVLFVIETNPVNPGYPDP
jgi:hypothetical protein